MITHIKTYSIAAALLLGAVNANAGENRPSITVFKTPWCGCCQVWVEEMEKAGFTLTVNDLDDLAQVKKMGNVPADMEACHTATIGDDRKYVLEGHVPVAAVEKLLSERPDIRGIAVPGMPQGSLGMGYDENARYSVYAFTADNDSGPEVFFEAGR